MSDILYWMEGVLKLRKFYFRRSWSAFFLILYLLIFIYFALFYIGNLVIATQFLYFTVFVGGTLPALSALFWGVLFLIALILPSLASIYAIILLHEIWTEEWKKPRKYLATVVVFFGVPILIIFADGIVRLAGDQAIFEPFLKFVGS